MNLLTLAKYLIGDRDAILAIARSPRAIWLGLLFVLSAGFAREYDGEDLWHEPWHLLLPLAASLVTATILFALLYLVSRGWRTIPSVVVAYRSFLTLYWMTAPLAFLYAIPVERFLSAEDATRANLWLLGIVSAWRVILMIRIVSIVWPLQVWQAIVTVLLFADTVVLILLAIVPIPIFSVMGGIRLSGSEHAILGISLLAQIVGMLSWPIWAMGTVAALFTGARKDETAFDFANETGIVGTFAWLFAAVALIAGIAGLPFTQPEQQRRYAVDHNLKSGHIDEALALMAQLGPAAFPPHWDPPPRVGYGERQPKLIDVLEALPRHEGDPWVKKTFHEKFLNIAADEMSGFGFWQNLDADDFDRYLTVIEQQFAGTPALVHFKLAFELYYGERAPSQRLRVSKLFGIPTGESTTEATVETVETSSPPAIYILAWNLESGGSDPKIIAGQLMQLRIYDICAFSEVDPKEFERFRAACGDDYQSVSSSSGNEDRLQFVFSSRFELVRQEELERYEDYVLNSGNLRSPLVVQLRDKRSEIEFIVIVNHLARGNEKARNEQAIGLREWARDQTLPCITIGDFNMDYDFPTEKGNQSFDEILTDDIWQWVRPKELVDTNWFDPEGDGDNFPESMLDFAFVAGAAKNWQPRCKVIVRDGDFPDDKTTSDHRPIELRLVPPAKQ